jgi:hypothetical protein
MLFTAANHGRSTNCIITPSQDHFFDVPKRYRPDHSAALWAVGDTPKLPLSLVVTSEKVQHDNTPEFAWAYGRDLG